MLEPIWKDTYYTTSADTLIYSIIDSATTDILFSGKAVKAPGEDTLNINVNRIVENYLDIEFPLTESIIESAVTSGATLHPDATKTVEIVDSSVTQLSAASFYYDWSYEDGIYSSGTPFIRQYLTFEIISAGTIVWNKTADNNLIPLGTLNYSINDGEWESLEAESGGTAFLNVNAGDVVRLKSEVSQHYATSFSGSTAYFNIYGNIMSMLYGDDFLSHYAFQSANTFYALFAGTNVIDAGNLILPATSLTGACYALMFSGCTNLTKAPALPATTMAGNCYASMFNGCTSLTTAPKLPATTLDTYCYVSMFQNCTSLTTAPELPATTVVSNCYASMFQNCTSLTKAPGLPATILAVRCYKDMFNSCSSLKYIKCLATDLTPNNCTLNWVNGTPGTTAGTFVKSASMTGWTVSVNGIPYSWNVVDDSGDEPVPEPEPEPADTVNARLSKPANNHYVPGQYSFNTYIVDDKVYTDWKLADSGVAVCSEWVLYYLNRFGGWDSYVVESKVVEKDDYEISKYVRDINNTRYLKGAETRFANRIEKSYELNTGWLTDYESDIIASQLFPSNKIFLHNVRTGKIVPVNITDTQVSYKTFNNERKLISYQINVKEANNTFIK